MKNMKCIYLFSVICICFLFSCGGKTQKKKFFDIPGYFKAEIDSIKTNFTKVSKITVYNKDTSHQELKVVDVNWEKEFAIFLEADINKPAYYAEMQEDEAGNYWTLSKKLSIQKVDLGYGRTEDGFSNYKVEHVSIQIFKSNLISTTTIFASYNKWGYKISGEQKIENLGDHNSFFVEGKFK